MNSTERKRTILEMLKAQESVQVGELTKILNVSKVTVRTDLDDLEQKGLLVRTHGGAILAERQDLVRLISNTIYECTEQKRQIAKIASGLVRPGQNIIIDSGSTTVHLARYISALPLTVATNSLLVIQELMSVDTIELLIAGGTLRRQSMSAIGNYTRECFKQIHADLLFLGASGFTLSGGVSCTNLIEADTKRAMIDSASKVCLMIDSTKFGKDSLARICDWSSIDILITDAIADDIRSSFEQMGVQVLTEELPQ
ncbi:MAG: DeoR/GlpR family DNA-binding transcription regulator [Sphaerochaetaceae bacterium]